MDDSHRDCINCNYICTLKSLIYFHFSTTYKKLEKMYLDNIGSNAQEYDEVKYVNKFCLIWVYNKIGGFC